MESYHVDDPGPCSQALTEQHAGIGIIVFSSTGRTLYTNQTAYKFLKVLNRWENGHATDGALPGAIAGLYDWMALSLASRMMQVDGETLEARRLLTAGGRTVRLHAFGIRDRPGVEGARVVITIRVRTHPVSDESSKTIPLSI